MPPGHDFEWELVHYYNRDQVIAMVINGKLYVAGGQPVGREAEDLRAAGLKAAQLITAAPVIVRCHGPSGTYRPSRP